MGTSDQPEPQHHNVKIHLMNGEVLEGHLPMFSPFITELNLYENGVQKGQLPKILNIQDVAYIFMHNTPEFVPNPPSKKRTITELIITTITSKRYQVLAFPTLAHTPGFYSAVKKDVKSSFGRIFFYFQGIHHQEKPERLGDLMIEQKLLSEDDIQRALEKQSQLLPPLGGILEEQGKVDAPDIDKALTTQKQREMKLGDLLVDQKLVSEKDVQQALKTQENSKEKPLGDILIEGGKVKNIDIKTALAIQTRPKMKLGELLIEAGLLNDKNLQTALDVQKERGKRLGEILLELKIIDEDQLLAALAKKFRLPTMDLEKHNVDPLAGSEISREVIERYRILPIQSDEHTFTIALADPMGLEAYDTISFTTGRKVREVLVKSSQLDVHLEQYLKEEELAAEFLFQDDELDEPVNAFEMAQHTEDAPIVKLVNRIIHNGLRKNASDIHMLPQEKKTVLAYRLNGDLISDTSLDKSLHKQIVARIKILSGMDITEQRMPQDGRLKLSDGKKVYEFRISCIPNIFGESLVLRMLNKEVAASLETLGLRKNDLKHVEKMANSYFGLILVTGPTGSGKSTTLFSILKSISHLPKHLITIEDPVESDIPNANQIQVNPKIGLTFSRVLRNILRHDPDIVMVGEMRDKETVEIGIEAALTGHLMFSTLHTNSAVDSIIRLNDMGIPNYLLAPALLGIISQNLIKRLCPDCRQKLPKNDGIFTEIEKLGYESPARLYKAGACDHCDQSGYTGRVMLYEMLTIDDKIRKAIHDGISGDELQQIAIEQGMIPRVQHALQLAADGIIDYNDLNRVLK